MRDSDLNKNNGGPAFPRPNTEDRDGYGDSGAEGMTLRDYFAAKALGAYVAGMEDGASAESLAEYAYELADAMLAERIK